MGISKRKKNKTPEDFFIVEISLGLHLLPILLRGPIFQ